MSQNLDNTSDTPVIEMDVKSTQFEDQLNSVMAAIAPTKATPADSKVFNREPKQAKAAKPAVSPANVEAESVVSDSTIDVEPVSEAISPEEINTETLPQDEDTTVSDADQSSDESEVESEEETERPRTTELNLHELQEVNPDFTLKVKVGDKEVAMKVGQVAQVLGVKHKLDEERKQFEIEKEDIRTESLEAMKHQVGNALQMEMILQPKLAADSENAKKAFEYNQTFMEQLNDICSTAGVSLDEIQNLDDPALYRKLNSSQINSLRAIQSGVKTNEEIIKNFNDMATSGYKAYDSLLSQRRKVIDDSVNKAISGYEIPELKNRVVREDTLNRIDDYLGKGFLNTRADFGMTVRDQLLLSPKVIQLLNDGLKFQGANKVVRKQSGQSVAAVSNVLKSSTNSKQQTSSLVKRAVEGKASHEELMMAIDDVMSQIQPINKRR